MTDDLLAGMDRPTPLSEALRLAALGLRVLPIQPHKKHPPMDAWQNAATNDPTIIRSWFTGLYREHGLGVATGPESGIWVLDVDTADDKTGDDTLAELEAAHGALPDTVEAITGSGGRHLWFRWPEHVVIRNNASTRLGPGLDIRGTGGQVVVAPTVHPNGHLYAWVCDHAPGDVAIAHAPGWLLDLLAEPERPAAPRTVSTSLPGEDGPAARYNQRTTWPDLLQADGWTFDHQDRDGEQYWVRPGKEARLGASATVGYQGADMLRVFTSSIPWLPEGAYSRFGYHAARSHAGDRSAAARAILADERTLMPAPARPETASVTQAARGEAFAEMTSWEPVNLRPILEGIANGTITRPKPTIAIRADGTGLWYPKRINGIFGDSGSGKSWVAMYAGVQQILAGHHVIWIDFEDQEDSVTIRMLDLGLTPEQIDTQFHYISPEIAYTDVTSAPLIQLVEDVAPVLIVIDSTGEAMAVQGTKDKDDEVAAWFRLFPRHIARMGPAVVVIDHVTKDPEARGLYAIGSQRKRAAIDGAAYLLEATREFGQGHAGSAKATVAKDRNGTHTKGTIAAVFNLDASKPSPYIVTLCDPDGRSDRPFRPTVLMEKISRILEITPLGMSKKAIETTVRGKAEYIRLAVELLVTEGYLSVIKGGQGGGLQHVSMKPYREENEAVEPVENPNLVPSSHLVPTSSRTTYNNLVPSSPTPKGDEVVADERTTPENTEPRPVLYHDPEEPF